MSNNNSRPTIRPTIVSSPLRAHAVRFGPGTDLVPALLETAATCNASCILTAVGSLEYVKLRMASAAAGEPNSLQYKELHERMEIVSLVGTFSGNPAPCNKHLHMSVSRRDGSVVGGHVMEGRIFTTLELVLGSLPEVTLTRETDAQTGYDELVVRSSTSATTATTTTTTTNADEHTV
mmetsp:Transcript_11227/g.21470  ORF Transcript_11227/g.21470 Transcript_11227/m.21470 type:complete len:178 (-) Transcript_11227:279-812(-)